MRLVRKTDFITAFRMTPELFDVLFDKINTTNQKETHLCNPISAGERLAVTLRYLVLLYLIEFFM